MRRFGNVLSAAALGVMLIASAGVMRADTLFSNFGANQTYVGNSWWDVGNNPAGSQVTAFAFVPSETASVTGATLPLALVPPPGVTQTLAPLTLYIESNASGAPGSILATLTQTGSYSFYPTTSLVDFACSGACATLDAGTTYWLVGQQTNSANTTGWFWSPNETGTWYYNEANSATGPWTVATAANNYAAFDVTGTPGTSGGPGTPPIPEPDSLVLLGTAMLGALGLASTRRLTRQEAR